jgi:putative ABC transport system permease protein
VIDFFAEVFETLARHGLRTALTLLSVGWGTFVLVLLLGAGDGLSNTAGEEFKDDAVNSLWVYRGDTSKPWDGLPVGRRVQFYNADLPALQAEIPEIEHLSARFFAVWGAQKITAGSRAADFDVRSVHPDHRYLENTLLVAGRWLDDLDVEAKRKVVIIGRPVSEELFRGADPLGRWISVVGVPFQVVGVFDDEGNESEARMVYLPISTAQAAFGGHDRVQQVLFTVGDASVEDSVRIEEQVRALFAARRRFDPSDPRAIRIRNNVESFAQIQRVLSLLRAFVWVVGLGTMTAGLVGVSNILLVSVRERTAEFGLRMAVGATPRGIVAGVVAEAVMLTSVAGYGGIVAGVLAIVAWRTLLPDNEYVKDPTVHTGTALVAGAILVVAGALAGAMPALRAANIHPVEALRDES